MGGITHQEAKEKLRPIVQELIHETVRETFEEVIKEIVDETVKVQVFHAFQKNLVKSLHQLAKSKRLSVSLTHDWDKYYSKTNYVGVELTIDGKDYSDGEKISL